MGLLFMVPLALGLGLGLGLDLDLDFLTFESGYFLFEVVTIS
jgi:hypothetical protein